MEEYFTSGGDNEILEKNLSETREESFSEKVAQKILDNGDYEPVEVDRIDSIPYYLIKKKSDTLAKTTGPIFYLQGNINLA